MDVVRARGNGGKRHVGGGRGVALPVVLADAEGIDPRGVDKHGLLDDTADALGVGQQVAVCLSLDLETTVAQFSLCPGERGPRKRQGAQINRGGDSQGLLDRTVSNCLRQTDGVSEF